MTRRHLFTVPALLALVACAEGSPTAPRLEPLGGTVVVWVDDVEGVGREVFGRLYAGPLDCVLNTADLSEPVALYTFYCTDPTGGGDEGVRVAWLDDAGGRARSVFFRRYDRRHHCVQTSADTFEPIAVYTHHCVKKYGPE